MSRSHENIIDIKTTPEKVFKAVTEPAEIKKWFGADARVEPRVGGEYTLIWGSMESKSTISAWEPNAHFGKYSERSKPYGGEDTGVTQRLGVDYYIESVGDGVTRLRLVQSGFGPDAAWDDEFESTKIGWAPYLQKLKEILEA